MTPDVSCRVYLLELVVVGDDDGSDEVSAVPHRKRNVLGRWPRVVSVSEN